MLQLNILFALLQQQKERRGSMSVTNMDSELQRITDRIDEVDKAIADLKEEREALDVTRKRYLKEKQIRDVLNQIFECSEENSMSVYLSRSTKTVKIMDEYTMSDIRFLIIKRHFFLFTDTVEIASLVIVKSNIPIVKANDVLTMTNLKAYHGSLISANSLRNDKGRFRELFTELAKIQMKKHRKGELVPFERPCILGGQTNRNREGYGWEYNGPDLVYEGTLYGETTKFLIIGVIIE